MLRNKYYARNDVTIGLKKNIFEKRTKIQNNFEKRLNLSKIII